jgi:molybdenum cofactor cytidylyltransferase
MSQAPDRSFSLATVILAAGASTRMGRPKLLLPWNQTTVLGHLVEVWSQLGTDQLVVVCAAGDVDIGRELDRLDVPTNRRVMNPDPRRGMFSSIQCAARWHGWMPALTHWAIVLGDQPHLQSSTLQTVIQAAAMRLDRIVQPSRLGCARHPVVIPETSFRELAAAPVDTLRQFLQSRAAQVELVELDDAGLNLDIDEPRDYETARRLFNQRETL